MSQFNNPRMSAGIDTSALLSLEFPQSLAIYEKYVDAQRTVDFLSDSEFPVQNCMIVGTDLKQIERVTGRLTRGRVAAGGAVSGAWLGSFVALIFMLFDGANSNGLSFIITVLAGMVFGLWGLGALGSWWRRRRELL